MKESQTCIQTKRIDNSQMTPELISILEWYLGAEDTMQIGLLPQLPPRGAFENIITANDVFLRYAVAYPKYHPTSLNAAKVISILSTCIKAN